MMENAETIKNELEELLQIPENKFCADCGRPGPEWASVTFGVFLCIECVGVHRTGISKKVKAVKLDQWTLELLKTMRDNGNAVAKVRWELALPPFYRRCRMDDEQVLREQWIRAKYERQEFLDTPEAKELRAVYQSGTKKGYLLKKGKDNNKWQKRYVELDGDKLHYFISDKDIPHNPKDSLPLLATSLSICSQKIDKPFSFQLTYNRRNYFFAADDGKSLVDWLNCIRAAKAKCLSIDEAMGDPVQLQRILDHLDQAYSLEGWMEKQGPQERGWKKRWFALNDDSTLLYYKNPSDAECVGFIQLGTKDQGYEVRENTNPPLGFCFSLITQRRTYSLRADNKDLVRRWIEGIGTAIEKSQGADSTQTDGDD